VIAASGPSPVPLLVLIGLGFVVGVCGHVVRSRAVVATGIGLIFLGSLLLPALLYVSDR
jgi:hypothetical protein